MTRVLLFVVLSCSLAAHAANLSLSWTNNLLTVTGANLPGQKLEVWYLEAFCKRGSTKRNWNLTTLPHKTELLQSEPARLRFRTMVQPEVELLHEVRAGSDEISIAFDFHNRGTNAIDIEWFQPACIRVAAFTGHDQTNYTKRSDAVARMYCSSALKQPMRPLTGRSRQIGRGFTSSRLIWAGT